MIKKLIFVYFIAVTLLAQFVFLVPAHAEPPHCFVKSLKQESEFHAVDCAEYAITIQTTVPNGPQNDTCYLISAGGPYSNNAEIKPYSADPNSDCGKWLGVAKVTQETPATCVVIDGSIGDWDDGKIKDLTKIHPGAKCDDYVAKLQASGIVPHIDPGNCYIIFNDNGKFNYTSGTCGLALEELISRQNKVPAGANVVTDPDREKVIHCGSAPKDGGNNETVQQCLAANPLVQTAEVAMNFLSAGVGIIVVVMIMIGGIQYLGAGNNPQAVAAGRKKISNALLALVAFMLLYAFMQWLLPGGPF